MDNTRGWPGNRTGRVVSGALTAMLMMSSAALAQQQAPMLDELVSSGALPPLEERLPANPLVVEPVESVGVYGGAARRTGQCMDRPYRRL